MTVAVVLAACHEDMGAWQQRLATSAVAKLGGTWSIELRTDADAGRQQAAPVRVTGVMALVLNRQRVRTSMFASSPVAFGTYDIALDALGVATGDAAGTPDVWVEWRDDSVALQLSPRSKWPIALVGVWQGDSLVGRWRADPRAGPGNAGDFVLRRR